MLNLNYLKRLGLHGGRLVWRALVFLVPALFFWIISLMRRAIAEYSEQDKSIHPSIYSYEEAWDALDKGQIGAAEMSYYDEVYGD